MESPNSEPEKGDGNTITKIPTITRTPSQLKSEKPRISCSVTPSPQSKIPKRDGGTPTKETSGTNNESNKRTNEPSDTKKATKSNKPWRKPHAPVAVDKKKSTSSSVKANDAIDVKKASKSMMGLGLTKTARPPLSSSRSNLNTQRSVKSRDWTPRSSTNSQQFQSNKIQKAADRAAANRNVKAFETVKEQVRTYQTVFLSKWEQVRADLPTGEGEYKLVGLFKNNDGHLITKDAQKVKIACPQKSVEDFKQEMRSYFESNLNRILDSLDQLKESSEKIGDDAVPSIEDVKKKLHTDNTNALADIIKQIESLELCEKPENESATPINSEFEGQIKNLLKEADELRKSLEQTQKELSRIKKSDEDKASSYKKDLEEKEKKFGKKQLELDELKKKLERLEKDASKDKGSHKELQEKLSSRSSEIEELKKKLKTSDQLNATEAAKIQQHETKIKSLEADLKSARIQLEKRAQVDDSIGDQATKHADEIRTLKESNSNEKKDKEKLTKEVQQLKKEIEKHAEMVSQFDILKDKIKLLGAENASLRRNIEDLENQLQNIEHHASASRNMNEDLSKLQQSETERDQKLQVLEMELRKAHFHNEKLEEKIAMDRKLLSIRHSIIESLQTKESTQKNHMETLFAEVGERNNDLLRLKTELLTKTEDFHKLFSTLSAKQIELTRQEHIIKLLKENNERTQTLRVKQEAKIGQLEEQIDHLKQTISIYQDAVLPNNTLKKNLLMIDANHDCDVTDNLEYYIDERRRKRHIDINVKKYEK